MSDLCELRGILIPRTSVNKGRSCSPVQPQIPLRVQIIVDSSVVGYDGAVRDEEHSVWQTKPEREQKAETEQSRWGFRGKTVWDWMALLIVPLVLVVIGLLFTLLQDARQQEIEDQRAEQAQKIEDRRAEQAQKIEGQRAEAERELAVQRAQDEALQAYLDQMSNLLLEKDLRESKEDSEVRTLARARTLTVLGRLDPTRKTAVMEFLVEAELVQRVEGKEPIIRLGSANLSGAVLSDPDVITPRGCGACYDPRQVPNLRGADLALANLTNAQMYGAGLTDANLSRANLGDADMRLAFLKDADLSSADLSGASLATADLRGADLSSADLSGTSLRWADLSGAAVIQADLSGADLVHADLSDANLSAADLIDADLSKASLSDAHLFGANFSGAKGITNEELEQQAKSLKRATMPNGQKYEDWLKDREKHQQDE
jgi:uncharacterized protein YjbI with pentapeptide repeats